MMHARVEGGGHSTTWCSAREFISKQVRVLICLVLIAPFGTYASETVIVNDISVRADSGESRVSPGGRVRGHSETSVTITTTVDGTVLEDFHERTVGASTPVVYERTLRASSTQASAQTVVHARALETRRRPSDSTNTVVATPTVSHMMVRSTDEQPTISNHSTSAEQQQYAATIVASTSFARRITVLLTHALLYVVHFFSY